VIAEKIYTYFLPHKLKLWRHDAMHRWELVRNKAYLIDSALDNSTEISSVQPYSLITTVYNESLTIYAFLNSVLHQQHRPAELIICDGGSFDNTTELIKKWQEQNKVDFKISLLTPGRCSIAKGRNLAAAEAKCEILVFADAGTSLDKHWALRLVQAFIEDVDFVCGWYKPITENKLQQAIAWFILPKLETIDPETFLPSARSLAIKKSVYQKVGGFPENLTFAGEDSLFGVQAKYASRAVAFVPDAYCYWHVPKNLIAMFKTIFRYAKGDGESGKLFWTYYIILSDRMAALFIHLTFLLLFVLLYLKWSLFFYPTLILILSYLHRAFTIANSYAAFAKADIVDILCRCLVLKFALPAQLLGFFSGILNRRSKSF
jgi:cellulose synthase/poly-beta-1,6-N-acetylglucosamine synthase-like glycosyltransferase